MKVLAIIGSARKKETFNACSQVARRIREQEPSLQWENVILSERGINQCNGCWSCFEKGEHTCPFYEDINDIWTGMKDADGIVLASPVYAMQVSAWMKVFIDRSASLFHRPSFHKPAIVISATAGGGLGPTIKYLRFAARGITIGLTESRVGAFPGAGGTQRLPRLIGVGRALQMMLAGEPVTSEYALDIGLVNEVVAPGELEARAHAFAKMLASRSAPALAAIKRLVYEGVELPLAAGLQLERAALPQILGSADYAEGLAAFAERRSPRFTEVAQ